MLSPSLDLRKRPLAGLRLGGQQHLPLCICTLRHRRAIVTSDS